MKISLLRRKIFADENLQVLVVLSAVCGVVIGFLVKKYIEYNPSDLFVACVAAVAALISYLAIESNREVKEKESEKDDLDKLADQCYEATLRMTDAELKGLDLVSGFSPMVKADRAIGKLLDEYEEYEEVDSEKADEDKRQDEDKSWMSEKEAVEEMIDFAGGDLDEKRSGLVEEYNEFIFSVNRFKVAANRMGLHYHRLENRHFLDDLDLSELDHFFSDYVGQFESAKELIHANFDKVMRCCDYEDEELESVCSMDVSEYGFPNNMEAYDVMQEAFRSPGAHVGKKTLRYLVARNRCVGGSVFLCFLLCLWVFL